VEFPFLLYANRHPFQYLLTMIHTFTTPPGNGKSSALSAFATNIIQSQGVHPASHHVVERRDKTQIRYFLIDHTVFFKKSGKISVSRENILLSTKLIRDFQRLSLSSYLYRNHFPPWHCQLISKINHPEVQTKAMRSTMESSDGTTRHAAFSSFRTIVHHRKGSRLSPRLTWHWLL
jgi:hypothetical protein